MLRMLLRSDMRSYSIGDSLEIFTILRIPLLRNLHRVYTQYLVKHPTPYLTSFAQVVLRKPEKTLV